MMKIFVLFCIFYVTLCTPINLNIKATGSNISMLTFITTVEGKSYFVDNGEQRDWESASKYCSSFGMRLASLETKRQFDALNQAYDPSVFNDEYWVSGRDKLELSQFVWNASGSEIPLSIPYQNDRYYFPYQTCLRYFSKPKNGSYLYPRQCSITNSAVICETV